MWKTVKLGEIASWVRGLTYSKKDEVDDGGIAVLRATNIDLATHKIVLDEIRLVSDAVKVKDDKYAQVGDLLVCTASGSKSHVGKVAIVEDDLGMAFGGFMAAIRCNEDCYPRFLYYILTSQKFKWHLNNLGDGANINNLKFSQIEEYELPLPPLAEQQRIVAKLDAAFTEIDRAVEGEIYHIDTAEQLRESILISRFSELDDESEQLLLSDACTDFSRGKSKHRPRNDERLYGDVIPFVQTGDISNAKKHLSTYTKMYSEFGIEQSKQWSKGTVCITIAANIAELAILDMKACFPDSVIGALPDENITSSEYIFYLLNYFQKKIKAKSKGFAQQNINLATFSDETFPFPTLERQKQISTELAELDAHIDSIIEIRNEKINSFHALKKSILAQEFQPSQGEAA